MHYSADSKTSSEGKGRRKEEQDMRIQENKKRAPSVYFKPFYIVKEKDKKMLEWRWGAFPPFFVSVFETGITSKLSCTSLMIGTA